MDKINNFMSVQNLQYLMAIFEKFMIDRYSINIQDNPNMKIKQIIFETMNKVHQQSAKQRIPIIDLNKITLSIVKNVVKNKLSLDSSNPRGNSLTRDRDIQKDKEIRLHDINRPQPSNKIDGMFSYDVNEHFDEISNIRAKENAKPFIPDDILKQSKNNLDDALSTEDFVKKLNSLEQARNMGTITKINPNTSNNNSSDDINTPWLSDVYKKNADVHPKELYTSKTDAVENFTDGIDHLRDIFLSRNNASFDNLVTSSTQPIPKTITKYLIIDSRDRDITKYPNPSEYIIDLDNIVKNIVEIQFWYAQYTKPTTTEHYVNMHIQEFDIDNFTKNNNFKDAFVQLPLTGDMMTISGSDFDSTKNFQTPLNKLSKLHIRFTKYNSELFDNMTEHLLRFKVTYIHSDQVIDNNVTSNHQENDILYQSSSNKNTEDVESIPIASNTDALEEDTHQI